MHQSIRKLGVVVIIGVLTSIGCNTNPPPSTPPQPVGACAKIGSDTYMCENGSPANLVWDGKGAITLSVVSDNPPQFSQVIQYNPSNHQNPAITVQNGTSVTANYSRLSAGEQVLFETPISDSYTIKSFYIEYGFSTPTPGGAITNNSTCSNPQTNSCYRWFKMLKLLAGTVPNCAQNFSIIINEQDPSGFVGNCN